MLRGRMGKYLLSGYNQLYPDNEHLSSPSLIAKIAYDKMGGLTLENYGKGYFCIVMDEWKTAR